MKPMMLQGHATQDQSAPTAPQLKAETPAMDIAQPEKPVFAGSSKDYAPSPTGYPILKNHPVYPYIDKHGTVDLTSRQLVNNPEHLDKPDPREYGSEYSARDQLPDGRHMSYPTIYDGQVHNRQEAFEHARKTGQYLNIFKKGTPPKLMDDSEVVLHARPQTVAGDTKPINGDRWAEIKKSQSDAKQSTPQYRSLFRQRNKWAIPVQDDVEGEVR